MNDEKRIVEQVVSLREPMRPIRVGGFFPYALLSLICIYWYVTILSVPALLALVVIWLWGMIDAYLTMTNVKEKETVRLYETSEEEAPPPVTGTFWRIEPSRFKPFLAEQATPNGSITRDMIQAANATYRDRHGGLLPIAALTGVFKVGKDGVGELQSDFVRRGWIVSALPASPDYMMPTEGLFANG